MRDTKVRDVMMTEPVTVGPETPVVDATNLLVEHGIASLPVVAEDGTYLGFLGSEDIIIEYARLPEPQFVEFLGGFVELPGTLRRFSRGYRKAAAAKVSDAMDPDPYTIGPDESVEDAASAMVFKHIHHLAVVDAAKRLLGVLSRQDILRLIQREMG